MTDLEFKAEDFEVGYQPNEIVGEVCGCEYAAEVANRILREKLEKAPLVSLCNDPKFGGRKVWVLGSPHVQDTHTGRLVDVREIKK